MDNFTSSNFAVTTSVSPLGTPVPVEPLCRERFGSYPPAVYNLVTCAFCFTYLYSEYNVSIDSRTLELVTGTNTVYPPGTRMLPDFDNATAVSNVCGSLVERSECWRWQSCCKQARACCQKQISEGQQPRHEYGKATCPRTWDGFACWSDTPAGQRVAINCPEHISHVDPDRHAYKTCTENGTWFISQDSRSEWTDYTRCANLERYKQLHVAGVACNIITIVLLVPACIIFLYYKPLRQQQRIRLHICLMISSFLMSVSMLMWEIIVFKDRIENTAKSETTMHQNSVGCRMLNLLTRWAWMTVFMWMLIEGFHLHRLLVHTFSVPKSLVPYYVFGYGTPCLFMLVYAIMRGVTEEFNKSCWVPNTGSFEWIIYTPMVLALAGNTFFLIRIVYIIVKQLEPHPNEPSNFRRAIKAVVVLVPLFGVQFILFVYQPPGEGDFAEIVELLRKITTSLQGAFVAIIFCYLNKEVQSQLKTSCVRVLRRGGIGRDFAFRSTVTTQYASDVSRSRATNGNGDSSHMIPLRPIYNPKKTRDEESNSEFRNGDLHTITENMDEGLPLNPNKHNS